MASVAADASFKRGLGDSMVESETSSRDEAACGTGQPLSAAEKHPLQHTWCMYVIGQTKDGSVKGKWAPNKIFEFNTVEDFWCMVNNIVLPSRMGQVDVALFREGVMPEWDDPLFVEAGRWTAKLDSKSRATDEIWINTMLALISSSHFNSEKAAGAFVSCRKFHIKVQLWLTTQDEQEAKALGLKFQEAIVPVAQQPSEAELAFELFHKADSLPWKARALIKAPPAMGW